MNPSLHSLRNVLESENWEAACGAAQMLGSLSTQEAHQVLIEALGSASALTRNSAALAIRDRKLQKAVPALIQAILNPANVNHRGTLVYALEVMDCCELFPFLFRLALEGNYECRIIALGILWDKGFYVSDDELNEAELLLAEHLNASMAAKDTALYVDLLKVLKNLREE